MPTSIDRPVPTNIEAEEATLGAILIDPDAITNVAAFLRPKDFYREKHRWIYEAMLTLHDRNELTDYLTVSDELRRTGRLESVGGSAAIAELTSVVPTAVHAEYYARIVERTALLRALIDAAGRIARLAYEEQDRDVSDTIDQAEQILFSVSQHRLSHALIALREVLREYYEHIGYLVAHKGEFTGVPTGFYDLDKLLGGLQAGDLIIIAARPAVGKTSFALNIAENFAVKQGGRVALFSLEMSAEQIAQRLVSSQTGIDSQRLRLGQISDAELERVMHAVGILSETAIYVDETPAISPMEVRTKARRLASEYGLDLVIVDYLQLMRAGTRVENRVQEISYISRSLKSLARELRVPVVALSQLSRELERRQDKRPILSDLRESGSIEQDADVVAFIYREDMYVEDTERRNIADIIVAKHRNGPIGTIPLRFIKNQAKFVNLETVHDEPMHETSLDVDF